MTIPLTIKNRPAVSRVRHSPFVIRHALAFSLLEILVAVGLLSVIILGLLAMFSQTEKAFRFGTRQVDVLESGRAVMELLVRELQEMTSLSDTSIVNLYVSTNFPAVYLDRRPGMPQETYLQDCYFLVQSNDLWTGVAYYIDPVEPTGNARVGSLYRYSVSAPGMIRTNLWSLYNSYQQALLYAPTNVPIVWHRVADNVVHLRLIPYDQNGIAYTNINLLQYSFPFEIAPNRFEYMPSYLDLEVAILEPRALERYRTIANPNKAAEYLTNRADKVHIFRQRISIRTSQ